MQLVNWIVHHVLDFIGALKKDTKVPIETVIEAPSETIVEETPMTEEESLQAKTFAFFRHTQNRAKERYNIQITYDVWVGWNEQIRNRDPIALFVAKTDRGDDVWRVWFKTTVLFVVFNLEHSMIVTAVPNKKHYIAASRKAMKKRADEAEAAKQKLPPAKIIMPTPVKKKTKLPILPPSYARPPRDERRLERMKAAALKKNEDYE